MALMLFSEKNGQSSSKVAKILLCVLSPWMLWGILISEPTLFACITEPCHFSLVFNRIAVMSEDRMVGKQLNHMYTVFHRKSRALRTM